MGITGLFWLFLSYGYVLYYASNLISEGSELLLLIPSMAGLVGGVVLPLLGAVPDGAIILFSGLGSIEDAQETLSVGVGALAGSTIMLLTLPFALSVYGGRVDIVNSNANYLGKPKVSEYSGFFSEVKSTGVAISEAVRHGGIIMMLTTLPYFLIQVPALFLHGPLEEVSKGEHWYSLAGLIVCLSGLVFYMKLQLDISRQGEDKTKRMAVTRKLLKKGKISLSAALMDQVRGAESGASTGYQAITSQANDEYPPPEVELILREILSDAFHVYDHDKNGKLDKSECVVFFRDFNENFLDEEMDALFKRFDVDKSGSISFKEFLGLAYMLIKDQINKERGGKINSHSRHAMTESAFEDVEEEEVPEEFTDLSPEQQQIAIKKRAFTMLALGALLVVLFSDPMVDVIQEIGVRANVSPFYVSFILAPLASNASEVLSSQYYASKKTTKTITVSLSALEGAACMNNTFCLSIFMGLIFFRGLAWAYTAETIAIVAVEIVVGLCVQAQVMTASRGFMIMAIFPASIAFVAFLEAIGLD